MNGRFIRPMELRDVIQVSQIEREAFPPPWPSTNFSRELTFGSLNNYIVCGEDLPAAESIVHPFEDNDCDGQSPGTQFGWLKAGFKRLFGGEAVDVPQRQFILGFIGFWFAADETHIASIAVRQSHWRRGIGEQLLIEAIRCAMERDAWLVTLEVRVSNVAAQTLYRKYGFIDVGIRKNYYMDTREDALLMTVDGITSASYIDSFQRLRRDFTRRWGVKV
ncbi:MAG: ribosomal protein S18-alanine N-acetyltransferase [Chloroflexota bacterium]|nr:ribosomal protein S18-alanine N-acetyltransferase [Chloroflexota bacterium]